MPRLVRLAGMALALATLASAARAAPPPIEAYGALPGVEEMKLSPDGDKVAFISVVGVDRRLVVSTVDGKPIVTAAVGKTKVRGLRWAGDHHVLVATTSTVDLRLNFGEMYEMETVVQIDLDTKKIWPVFENTPSVASTVFGSYGAANVDGREYAYFGGITYASAVGHLGYAFDHGWTDLYRVDLATGQTDMAAPGTPEQHDWVVTAEGRVVAHSEYNQEHGQWRLVAGAAYGPALLTRDDPKEEMDLLGQGRTPGTVLVEDDTGPRDQALEAPLGGGKPTQLFPDLDVTEYLFDPQTHLLIGALTEDEPGATFFDPLSQARYAAVRKAFQGLHVELVSYTSGLARMIVFTDGGQDSGSYWLVDIASLKATPLGYAYQAIEPKDVGQTRMVSYKAADGLAMEGVLTLPPGREAKGLPLVMMPHGGPIGIRDRVGFDWWAQAFAARGYAVFQPNYRGSGGYGAAFRKAGFGEWGRKMLSDMTDGLGELARAGVIDPKRVCIVGGSYGGYAALAGVTLQNGFYRCAVAVAGVADLPLMMGSERDRAGRRSATIRFLRDAMGADKLGEGALHDISPSAFAKNADAPILLIHGKDDTVVPFEQSQKMAAALKAAGKPYDFVVMPGEDHWLSRGETRTTMLKAAVAFVEKYDPAE